MHVYIHMCNMCACVDMYDMPLPSLLGASARWALFQVIVMCNFNLTVVSCFQSEKKYRQMILSEGTQPERDIANTGARWSSRVCALKHHSHQTRFGAGVYGGPGGSSMGAGLDLREHILCAVLVATLNTPS